VTGNFRSDAVFGSGEANETTMSSSNWYGQDLFIASYDPDGSLLWARNAQSPWGSFSMDIAAGPGGGTAIAGFFGNEVTFSPGEPDQMSLSAMGELSYPEDFDVFVVRYDANGHLTLAESAGGVISWDEGRGVIITPDDRLLVMGVVSSANFFWPGPSHLILSGPEFIARFSSCSNTEACEGTDDDCDGTIDEECPCTEGESMSCGFTDEGTCEPGTQLCAGGIWELCEGGVGPISEATDPCDWLDNDCDGWADEGWEDHCFQ
jgi:hypothetical protein